MPRRRKPTPELTADALPNWLHERGLRMTPQRAVIFEVMLEVRGHQHLTAQEVLELAQDRLPGLNRATVYRTLEALYDLGLMDRMMVGPTGTEVRFAARKPHQRHAHLVCRKCAGEFELSLTPLLALADRLERETGFRMDVDHLTLNGFCARCAPSAELVV